MAYEFNPFTGTLDKTGGAGGGGTPGGADTQVQFNDGGSFGGSADLTWDDTGKVLGIGGDIDLDDGGTYATTLQVITPTANRTISFPNATGTLALVAGSSGQLIYNNAGANAGTPTLTYDGSILTSTGRFINSYNATASSPAKAFTGTWFTGGTATTTKPQVLIEPAGTTSTAWSTSGTGLGVNAASGFTGNLLDLQVGGVSKISATYQGGLYIAGTSATTYIGSTFNGLVSGSCGVNYGSSNCLIAGSGGLQFAPASVDNRDLTLIRDAADTLAQRRGTNAQTYRLYNTYTDASNYQRTSITDDSTGLVIDQQYAGTGAARANLLDLKDNGTSKVFFGAIGNSATSPAIGIQSSRIWAPSPGCIAFGGASGASGLHVEGQLGAGLISGGLLWWASNSTNGFYSQRDIALKRDQANVLAITNGSTGTGYLKQTPVAVSALPAAATVGAGTRGFVSDSTVAASGNFGATVTGGGSNNVPVFSDGTNWLIG